MAAAHVFRITRVGDGAENANDGNHDHQFDERKASLFFVSVKVHIYPLFNLTPAGAYGLFGHASQVVSGPTATREISNTVGL